MHTFTSRFAITGLFLILSLVMQSAALHATESRRVLINEFLALNSKGLQDEDGDYSDWIELYNPGDEAVNLEGWYLTDNAERLNKWQVPAVTLRAGGFLVVFASEKNRRDAGKELHTNFKLSGSGEYLALVEPDGSSISHEYAPFFPPQQSNVSYGLYMGQYAYFSSPTPGSDNTIGNQSLTPVFSMERGYYKEPFTVALSIGDPETAIHYTTDGTRPTANSPRYTEPIQINSTTPVSAVGIKEGVISEVVSHTYFFMEGIIKQPQKPTGYPDTWGILNMGAGKYQRGERVGADYAMDAGVCESPTYKPLLKEAFTAIPSISVVTTPGYIFSHSTDPENGGIYIYTGDTGLPSSEGGSALGREWERPASVEYFDPKTGKQFQINCGLRLHGGNSRKQGNSLKHSFRLSFRKQYGAGKLNFKLFEEKDATESIDHLVLRAGYNITWVHNNPTQRNNAQYIIDSFAKKSQLAMGHLSPHNRFVHLYLNGLYWGLYDLSEKINDNFLEAYLGGKEEDYDVINDDYVKGTATGIVDGNAAAYDLMLSTGKSGDYDALVSKQLLDAANYIDYLLLNFFIGNQDWGKNNWFAGRNRTNPGDGFRYYSWDAENSLNNLTLNTVTGFEGPLREILFGSSQSGTGGGLSKNADFKLLFADRIEKHLQGNGALTPTQVIARYEKLAEEIDLPIILESARWGDMRKTLNPGDASYVTHTRNDHWLPRKNQLISGYFPERTGVVFEQLKAIGLYPAVNAPKFSSEGGELEAPVLLEITSSSGGTIYYTIDGTDPRVAGSSSVSPTSSAYQTPLKIVGEGMIKARVRNGSTWSALAEVSFLSENKEEFVEGQSSVDDLLHTAIDVYYADNTLYYTLNTDGNLSIEIISATDGRILLQPENGYVTTGIYQTTLSELPQGMYLYRIIFNGEVYTGKFNTR